MRFLHVLLLLAAFLQAAAVFAAETESLEAAPSAPASTDEEFPPIPSNEVVIQNATPDGEVEYSSKDGLWYGRHGVQVLYEDMELVANQAVLSERTGDIIADGNVRFRHGEQYWVGEHLEYNYRTGHLKGENFRAGFPPFFAQGLQFHANTDEQRYTTKDTFLTPDDIQDPDFKIVARQYRVVPGRSIEARSATLYVADVPVFFLPYYKRSLTSHRAFWRVTPGYRSAHGAYLRNAYHFPIATNLTGTVNLDLYSARGVGLGPDLEWKHERWGAGQFSLYYIQDQDPRRREDMGFEVSENRHRTSFSHRMTLRTNLTAKVVVREQSDALIVRDFFESEYRNNTQPRSFVEVNQLWQNWSLDLMAQAQINEFFQTVERLPDLRLSGFRQQIGETPLFYESESSLAYLRFNPAMRGMNEYSAMRADSFHQVVWPQNYFGWLNFVPRVGGRLTHYGEEEGFGTTFDERSRFVFNTGAETSVKASRVWRGIQSKFWELNELRHIIEPSINYVFVPKPNYTPNQIPQFDQEIPTLRLLPIEYPDYNAIDAIDSQNVLRFGVRNRLQTKREEGIQNVIHWALFTDWRLDPRQGQSTFADIYSDLVLRPRSWLTFSSETRYDVDDGHWNAAFHSLTIAPGSTWSTSLGHRYFRGGPEFGPESGNNTIYTSFYYKFNENWAARMTHHYEARDGTLEEQYYTVYRDFRSWTGALTLRLREHRFGADEFAIAFTFQFKAFPRFRLGSDRDEPSLLLGS